MSRLFLIALLFSSAAIADDDSSFYTSKERGWFWYQREPEDQPEPPPVEAPPPPTEEKPKVEVIAPPSLAVAAPPEEPAPLSSEWLRKNMEKYLFKALDDPTKEHVADYLFMQRLALDRSSRFADAGQVVTSMYPELQEDGRRPMFEQASAIMSQRADAARSKVLKDLSKDAMVYVVYSSDCPQCVPMFAALKTLSVNSNFNFSFVSSDGKPLPGVDVPGTPNNPKLLAKLNPKSVPSVYIERPGESPVLIADAPMAANDLSNNIVRLAYGYGWISHDAFESTRARHDVAADFKPSADIPQETLNDPGKLAEMIRASIAQGKAP